MAEDISNKTIVVLVILTVIISVLGTVVVLNEISTNMNTAGAAGAPVMTQPGKTSGTGEVRLTVVGAQEPMGDSATGYIALTIV